MHKYIILLNKAKQMAEKFHIPTLHFITKTYHQKKRLSFNILKISENPDE